MSLQETAADRESVRHLAVIMDGNGRWARRRGLPRRFGHRAGAKNLRRLCVLCGEHEVRYLTVYAFSTENWKRPPTEVAALMKLFLEFLDRYDAEMAEEGIRIRLRGDRSSLPDEVARALADAEARSAERNRLQLILALNYGGRDEIVRAARQLAKRAAAGELAPEKIDEALFAASLDLPDVPDPDLVIRPSGEQRLSNFLLWQSAYAELWFANVLWPDFAERDFLQALADFAERDRRYGGIERGRTG